MSLAAMTTERPKSLEPLPTLWGPEQAGDPFPTYASMRRAAPATKVRTPGGEVVWAIMRYDAVVDVLKDPRVCVDQRRLGVRPPLLARWVTRAMGMDGDAMIMVDDPEHYRLRSLVHKAFTPRSIEKLEGWIVKVANQLLDAAAEKDEVDLMAAFAQPLPLTVISEMIGVPEAERLQFAKLVSRLFDFASISIRTSVVQMATSGFLLRRYIGRLIAMKRRNPDDRLLSQLLAVEEQGDRLSESELIITVFLLLFAGHETTVNLIGNGTLALFDHPDQLRLLRERPDLAPQAVEELLRFAPPVEYGVPRYAMETLQIDDVTIERGELIIALLSAAGRDETAFPDPDRLDITREKNRQITFGFGSHFCLGAPLARMEGAIAFRALAERFPNMRLAVDRDRLEWWSALSLRGLRTLPVHLY